MFKRSEPYNNLPPLPPPTRAIESVAVLKALATTTESIGYLNGLVQATKSKQYLSDLLPAIEAQASSAIEGVVTTVSQLMETYGNPAPDMDPMSMALISAVSRGSRSRRRRFRRC